MGKKACLYYVSDVGLLCSFLVFITSFKPHAAIPVLFGGLLVLGILRILLELKPRLMRWLFPLLVLLFLVTPILRNGVLLLYERVVDVYHASSGYTFSYPPVEMDPASIKVVCSVTFLYVAALSICIQKHVMDKQQYGRAFLLSFLIILPALFYSTPIVWGCFAPVTVYWLWLLGMHNEQSLRPAKPKRRSHIRAFLQGGTKKEKTQKEAAFQGLFKQKRTQKNPAFQDVSKQKRIQKNPAFSGISKKEKTQKDSAFQGMSKQKKTQKSPAFQGLFKQTKTQKNHTQYSLPPLRVHQLTLLLCCALVVGTILLMASPTNYQRRATSSEFRSRLLQRIDDLAYQIQYGSQKKGEVDLGRAGNRFYSGAVQFRIKSSDMQGTIYLKTISEAVYENNGWKPVSKQRYEDADVDWEEVHQRYGNERILHQKDGKPMHMELQDERSDQQYALLPYGLIKASQTLTPYYDSYQTQPKKDMSYTFLKLPEDVRQSDFQRSAQEDAYTRFVYQNYLQVPTEIEDLFNTVYPYDAAYHGYYEDDIQLPYTMIETDIINFLEERTTYTLRPGRSPKDRDFVEYFLNTNKKGYCVHYATTATLLFRYMGIPARYAEGFSFHASELDHGKGDVLDYSAHAWVEIYDERYGWMPVEVTPGYSSTEDAKNEGAAAPKVKQLPKENVQDTQNKETTTQTPALAEAKTPIEAEEHGEAWWQWVVLGLSIPVGYYAVYRLQGYRYKRRCLQGNVKQGIANSYAWLSCLHKEKVDEELYALIQEALYSSHDMSVADAQRVYTYVRVTLRKDIRKKSFFYRLYLHLRLGV